jgi:hypothetical protein
VGMSSVRAASRAAMRNSANPTRRTGPGTRHSVVITSITLPPKNRSSL